MSKGLADVKEGGPLHAGDGGEGVPQTVKGDFGHPVPADKAGEGEGQGVGGTGLFPAVEHHMAVGRDGLSDGEKIFPLAAVLLQE